MMSPDGKVDPLSMSPEAAHMTGTDFHQKTQAQAQRLIQSVNAVTDLLKANTELRDTNERITRDLQEKDAENIQLQLENQQIRERLELVEQILKNNSNQLDTMVSQPVKQQIVESNTKFGKFGGYDKN